MWRIVFPLLLSYVGDRIPQLKLRNHSPKLLWKLVASEFKKFYIFQTFKEIYCGTVRKLKKLRVCKKVFTWKLRFSTLNIFEKPLIFLSGMLNMDWLKFFTEVTPTFAGFTLSALCQGVPKQREELLPSFHGTWLVTNTSKEETVSLSPSSLHFTDSFITQEKRHSSSSSRKRRKLDSGLHHSASDDITSSSRHHYSSSSSHRHSTTTSSTSSVVTTSKPSPAVTKATTGRSVTASGGAAEGKSKRKVSEIDELDIDDLLGIWCCDGLYLERLAIMLYKNNEMEMQPLAK